MTPEEKIRVRDLPKLIANENDFAKMKVLAIELEPLSAKELSWLEKYRKAALETNFTKVRGRIQAAEFAMHERQRAISQDRGGGSHENESDAIGAALVALKTLRGDVLH
jgi:hypothetical protein